MPSGHPSGSCRAAACPCYSRIRPADPGPGQHHIQAHVHTGEYLSVPPHTKSLLLPLPFMLCNLHAVPASLPKPWHYTVHTSLTRILPLILPIKIARWWPLRQAACAASQGWTPLWGPWWGPWRARCTTW